MGRGPHERVHRAEGAVMINEATPFYVDDDGILRVPIAYRRWHADDRDRRIAALVRCAFDDGRRRHARGIR